MASLHFAQASGGQVGVGLANVVAELLVEGEGLPDAGVAVGVAAEPFVGTPEAELGAGLGRLIGETASRGESHALNRYPVMPVASPAQVRGQRRGQLAGVHIETALAGQADRRQQDLPLGLEPAEGLPVVA